ncbi:MAG: hypothetical protein VXZ18_19480, partial [Pseudomonadota bacterium]|nr:hypothetical protein [Pseudomonadota bacterium]
AKLSEKRKPASVRGFKKGVQEAEEELANPTPLEPEPEVPSSDDDDDDDDELEEEDGDDDDDDEEESAAAVAPKAGGKGGTGKAAA